MHNLQLYTEKAHAESAIIFCEELGVSAIHSCEREKPMFSQVVFDQIERWSGTKSFTKVVVFIVYEDDPKDPEKDDDEGN